MTPPHAASPQPAPPPRRRAAPTPPAPVAVVGAGIGGLMAALACRAAGRPVVLVDAADAVGGKLRQLRVGDAMVDAGPTVLTMPWIFARALAGAGLALDDYVPMARLDVVARHFWADGSQLDLVGDTRANAEAIGAMAGAGEAAGYRRFAAAARTIYQRVLGPFVLGPKPTLGGVWRRHGLAHLAQVARIDAHLTMRRRLAQFFTDPRLLQLFGRMSTYAGGAPGLTPATLNLIAHVETQGVYRAHGGIIALAHGLARALTDLGVQIRLGRAAHCIERRAGRVVGVRLEDGECVAAGQVIVNAPPAAVAALTEAPPPARRSGRRRAAEPVCLSADIHCMVARAEGAALAHHNLFFAEEMEAEFTAIFAERRRPERPTVYVCAQGPAEGRPGSERLLCLTNAPSTLKEPAACSEILLSLLARRGLTLTPHCPPVRQAPRDFAARFPHSQGALYGDPPHGWRAFFRRPGSHTPVRDVFACGGHHHPGPGLPMTALGGLQAASACLGEPLSMSP